MDNSLIGIISFKSTDEKQLYDESNVLTGYIQNHLKKHADEECKISLEIDKNYDYNSKGLGFKVNYFMNA